MAGPQASLPSEVGPFRDLGSSLPTLMTSAARTSLDRSSENLAPLRMGKAIKVVAFSALVALMDVRGKVAKALRWKYVMGTCGTTAESQTSSQVYFKRKTSP